jgi:hypothetical protein
MHVLNCPTIGQTLMSVMKQFFKPKLLDRTIFHKSLDDLYQFIPKQYLPKDYGGDEPSLEDFRGTYRYTYTLYPRRGSKGISDISHRRPRFTKIT